MRETEQHPSREREINRERKETKEKELDPEAARAAMKERADYLVKEVKTNKQQMQNIVVHMQQVMVAIRAIREQLQLEESEDNTSSIVHDTARVEKLKEQIALHKDELIRMKDDLIRMQTQELDETMPHLSYEQKEEVAKKHIDKFFLDIF